VRKPTPFKFFAIEIIVWLGMLLLVGSYNDWSTEMALSIYLLKVSAINIVFAILNIMLACIGMATGFYPWKD
jgi:hypothetical protein